MPWKIHPRLLRSPRKAFPKTWTPDKTSKKIGEFYDLHARMLFSLALKILEDSSEAEEALVAVFTEMAGVLSYYEFKDPKRLLAWAMVATMRTAAAMKANPGLPAALTNRAFG